jgi:hypothetical protein
LEVETSKDGWFEIYSNGQHFSSGGDINDIINETECGVMDSLSLEIFGLKV